MKRSSDRILTTHVGSLARPHDLLRLMQARARAEPYDADEMERAIAASVKDLVKRQVEVGLDIVADGEQSKTGFFHYARERLTGFEVDVDARPAPRAPEEMATFPEYYERYFRRDIQTIVRNSPMVCTGPVTYIGQSALQRDIDNLKAALDGLEVDEAFIPASAPRAFGAANRYYSTDDEFFEAVGDALREEYRGIIDAGFLLQVDDPALTNLYSTGMEPVEERRKKAHRYIELLNYSLRGIPEDRVRFHTCYGINEGPRIFDVPLADIAEFMLKVNAQAFSFECANPRHDH
jgi:5-methyltetrahydropteroyltriglutamate--homocysteine methyltransferase